MRKLVYALAVLFLLNACSDKKQTKNLLITGNIEGFKKGTIYIQRLQDTLLINLDSIEINGDSKFVSQIDIDSPEMLYLSINRGQSKSLDNNLPFFAEQGKMTIETSLNYFTSDAKITGSKNQDLYNEYKNVMSSFIDKDLEIIKKKYEALRDNQNQKIDSLNERQKQLTRRKYLYSTNFAVNHSDYEVAPYIGLSEIYDINLKYLDTITKSMTPKVAKSKYGKQLKVLLEERKRLEK
jgi:hypothetical protein